MALDIHMTEAGALDLSTYGGVQSIDTQSSDSIRPTAESLTQSSLHSATLVINEQLEAAGDEKDGNRVAKSASRKDKEAVRTFLWCKSQDNNVDQPFQDYQYTTEILNHNISQSSSRFTPQVVATTQRSRKAGDDSPALLFSDKTDAVPFTRITLRHKSPQAHLNAQQYQTSIQGLDVSTAEARRLGLPLPKQGSGGFDPLASQRRVLTFSPTRSPLSSQTDLISLSVLDPDQRTAAKFNHTQPLLTRHSRGLVALAVRKAERQLHEQALAAFPNDDRPRQSVNHYLDVDETPPASVMASTVGSAYSSMSELEVQGWHTENWELNEIRAHHETLHAEREEYKIKRDARRKAHKSFHMDSWTLPSTIPEDRCTTGKSSGDSRDGRPRIRPPMLGSEIEFPRSHSPDPARFDVTQGPESIKKAMCYLSEQSVIHADSNGCGGLWIPRKEPSTVAGSCTWSRPASRKPSTAGLWGGSCIDNNSPPRGATGIMTPKFEEETQSVPKDGMSLFRQQLPPSPPMSSNGAAATVTEERELSQIVQEEFNDSFITQVFNYMSLGYPAIARDFDEELCKVTGVALVELRKDDDLPTASCGYIRLGEETAAASGVTEQSCARWRALRLYVHEWARQHPKLAQIKPMETGWSAARKGSWAW